MRSSSAATASRHEPDTSRAVREGLKASIPGLPKVQKPGGKQFMEKYKAKFNTEVQLFAPKVYDA